MVRQPNPVGPLWKPKLGNWRWTQYGLSKFCLINMTGTTEALKGCAGNAKFKFKMLDGSLMTDGVEDSGYVQ